MPDERGETHPLLSDSETIVVIADEAHRSQYDFIDGFAGHLRAALPNASFIGFTGTPIELTDKNTRAVFGNYIDTYDIQRAVEDGATVPIYYEGRLAKIDLPDEQKPVVDAQCEEVTESTEVERREKLKSKWAKIEAMVGTDRRLELVAKDLVKHFEARQVGDPATPMKGMVVCMRGASSLTTMYVDKPMRGHGLMQAIARVNRVFRDKLGGVVVDYLGIAFQLKQALMDHTDGGGKGDPVIDQAQAVAVMLEKYEIVHDMLLHGFDFIDVWARGTHEEKLRLIGDGKELVLDLDDGKRRHVEAVTALGKAFSLAVPHADAMRIRDEVGFFQTVRAAIMKTDAGRGSSDEELDMAVRQIVSKAVSTDGVVDVFAVAGLEHPDISFLDDKFLAEVRDMPRRNLAVELLQKLLRDEVTLHLPRNLVESRRFSEMLQSAVIQYQNRAITSAQVIEELINSAVTVLGEATLKKIAQELVGTVKRNATIDWSLRESARAKMRVMVKRLLRKYDYPPDKQEHAMQLMLKQAEAACAE